MNIYKVRVESVDIDVSGFRPSTVKAFNKDEIIALFNTARGCFDKVHEQEFKSKSDALDLAETFVEQFKTYYLPVSKILQVCFISIEEWYSYREDEQPVYISTIFESVQEIGDLF